MVDKIKEDIGDYLRRIRSCVLMPDDIYKSLTEYILASIENAYYEGAKNTDIINARS